MPRAFRTSTAWRRGPFPHAAVRGSEMSGKTGAGDRLRPATSVLKASSGSLAALFLCQFTSGVARIAVGLLSCLEGCLLLCRLGSGARGFFGCYALGFCDGVLASRLFGLTSVLPLRLPGGPCLGDRLALTTLLDKSRIVWTRCGAKLRQKGLAGLCSILASILEIWVSALSHAVRLSPQLGIGCRGPFGHPSMVGKTGAGEGIRTLGPNLGEGEITTSDLCAQVRPDAPLCAGVRGLRGSPDLNSSEIHSTGLNRSEGRRLQPRGNPRRIRGSSGGGRL